MLNGNLKEPLWISVVALGIIVCAALIPVGTLTTQSIPSIAFYAMLVFALILLWYAHKLKLSVPEPLLFREFKWLFYVGSFFIISILLSKLFNGKLLNGTEIEKGLRFSLGLPLLVLAMRHISYAKLKHMLWGVYLSVVSAFVFVLHQSWPDFDRPITHAVHNAVSYGVITLIMAVITFYSIGISLTSFPKKEKALKIVIGILGVATFVLTQTRTGLLGLPIFILFGMLIVWHGKSYKKFVMYFLILTIISIATLVSIPSFQDRFELTKNEVVECLNENSTSLSSFCVRLQLWRAALDVWDRNPIIGTGSNRDFRQEMQEHALPKGIVSEFTVKQFGEPHNDYLQAMSSFGLVGLLGLLTALFAPAYFFIRRLIKSPDLQARCYAAMGASFCLGYSVFSFTELMFRNMRSVSFYTAMIACLIVLSSYPNLYKSSVTNK